MNKFDSKEEAVKKLRKEIVDALRKENEESRHSTLLLSGGSTPGPLYKDLNENYDAFSKTTIGLVDERFVPTTSEHSNERLVRDLFSNSNNIVGMVHNETDHVDNIVIAREHYKVFCEKLDVVVLGMGADGHTASLFPDDPNSDLVMEIDEDNLFNTNAPSLPMRRITCSKSLLTKAKRIFLLIFGEEKLRILTNNELNLPIHKLLRERKDIEIYYA